MYMYVKHPLRQPAAVMMVSQRLVHVHVQLVIDQFGYQG